MNKKFLKIHTNKNGYSVWAGKLHDGGTKKIEIGIMIQDPKGDTSEIITVKKSRMEGKITFV